MGRSSVLALDLPLPLSMKKSSGLGGVSLAVSCPLLSPSLTVHPASPPRSFPPLASPLAVQLALTDAAPVPPSFSQAERAPSLDSVSAVGHMTPIVAVACDLCRGARGPSLPRPRKSPASLFRFLLSSGAGLCNGSSHRGPLFLEKWASSTSTSPLPRSCPACMPPRSQRGPSSPRAGCSPRQ